MQELRQFDSECGENKLAPRPAERGRSPSQRREGDFLALHCFVSNLLVLSRA